MQVALAVGHIVQTDGGVRHGGSIGRSIQQCGILGSIQHALTLLADAVLTLPCYQIRVASYTCWRYQLLPCLPYVSIKYWGIGLYISANQAQRHGRRWKYVQCLTRDPCASTARIPAARAL